jgi:hypothetical protein
MDYNKQIAPITKKIERLNSNHETKSLRAHKDFLTKEKKSKERLNELTDKAIIKDQKIEKAAQNKVVKLHAKERRIRKEYEDFVIERKEISSLEYIKIDKATTRLKKEEIVDTKEIEKKYKTNIESYVEKLDIYNNNFEKNKNYHVDEIKKHQEMINIQLETLKQFNEKVVSELDEKLGSFTNNKNTHDKEIKKTTKETSRMLSNYATNIRKQSNVNINEIEEYMDTLKQGYEEHLEPVIEILEKEIVNLKVSFEERQKLIEDDLELNIIKLDNQLEGFKEEKNRKAIKNINMKINLFNVRATTTVKYEERILNEKVLVLENEKDMLKEKLEYEILNLDKLSIFLLNDQNELKETGDYFKELNLVLKTELNNFELSNNNYLLKHEQLKTDFIRNYTKIFSDLKESTITLAQSYLEKIADNNFEIDEINKFLDTAEPLKEIEVNRLREDIEVSEVIERFKIKYAKQDYETNLVQNIFNTDSKVRELQMKEELSEVKKEDQMIKIKEVYDKSLEKAKLKHSKAQEVYNLRLNNTKLERNLLKNKYDTELAISVHNKELTEIDVRKHNALVSKEIEYSINNHEMEANYKIEVVNKGLEEDLLKLEEQVSKVKYEKDAYSANLNSEIENKKSEFKIEREDLEQQSLEKINLIEQALAREIKVPSRNILKTETIIDERLSKLDINNVFFIDFINDSIEDYKDNKLTLEQIRVVIINNDAVYDKATKYINRTYQVLNEAVKFMNDIEKHAVLNNIAASHEQGVIKKLQKQKLRIEAEYVKQSKEITQSEGDHLVLINNLIKEQVNQIKNANFDELNELVMATEHAYNKIFDKLKDIQSNIKDESSNLYKTLTKNDNELIAHAELNAEKAIALVEESKQNSFKPLNESETEFIIDKESLRREFDLKMDIELKELRAEINHHKNVSLEKVQEINTDKDVLISTQKDQKHIIEESEDKAITERYEKIADKLHRLNANYNYTLEKLDIKDAEAKKIFDYEDRIYNIAVESATSRFNDANVKTDNRHLNKAKQYRDLSDTAVKNKDKNIGNFNKELLNLTNNFEKNIFTVRPRLEESIGDAQKAIDKETKEKELKLQELIENNKKLILTTENMLYTAFHEGYDRLNNNLTNYIEKYRIIEEEYIGDNNKSNDVLTTNNITFSNALFELAKNKHLKTQEDLLKINTEILSEEDNNG